MLKRKNLLSSAIAVALCLSLNTTAFAAKNDSKLTEKQLNSVSLTSSNELLDTTDSVEIGSLKADSMTDEIEALTSTKSLTASPKSRSAISLYASDSDDSTNADPQVYATEISTNVTYTDTINQTGDVHYYLFDTTNLSKITAVVLFQDSTTFSTNLYKYTDEGSLEIAAQSPSNFPYSDSETVSAIAEGGIYVLEVISSEGTGDFNFRVQTSSSYSANEPNDSIYQANQYTDSMSITDTFDNGFDFDWSKLVVSKDCEYKISTSTSNCSISSFLIFNLTTGDIQSITGSQNSVTLGKGTYYILVNGTTTDVDNSYTLKILPASSVASSVKANVGSDYVNYEDGCGPTWRFKGNSFTVTGTAYNEDGQIAPYAELTVATQTPLNNKIYYGKGTSDEDGKFSIVVNIDSAIGQNVYYLPLATHYYDIIPVVFFNSNMDDISSNMNYLYHFSYSDYHGYNY